ncbi:hypothetical protein PR048_033413 [Dryococelus australis]|uniref:Uncharacterized protein n=1 Tax=Dryococelus australis TaxID=614101 RepID=A0ABQ9G083_9NEOP|nr:hypothetical protein PR048_033413 [Dryococelus australis]
MCRCGIGFQHHPAGFTCHIDYRHWVLKNIGYSRVLHPEVKICRKNRKSNQPVGMQMGQAVFSSSCNVHFGAITLFTSHLGKPGSIPGQATSRFSQLGIVLDDVASRRVFFWRTSIFPHSNFDAAPFSPHSTLIGSQDPFFFKAGKSLNSTAMLLLPSHQGKPGSILGRVTPGFSLVGIVPGRCRWSAGFRGDLPPPPPSTLSFRRCSTHTFNLSLSAKRTTRKYLTSFFFIACFQPNTRNVLKPPPAEKCGNDKGEIVTRIKCAIATKSKTLNRRAVFSSHCMYLGDFQRRPYHFIGARYRTLKMPFLAVFGVLRNGVSVVRDLSAQQPSSLKCVFFSQIGTLDARLIVSLKNTRTVCMRASSEQEPMVLRSYEQSSAEACQPLHYLCTTNGHELQGGQCTLLSVVCGWDMWK